MNHMETARGYIEITRRQIIGQLEKEISQFQDMLEHALSNGSREEERWEKHLYQTMISRKQQLISRLS